MRFFLILGVALLCTLASAHHEEGHHDKDDKDSHEHHDHKDDHHKEQHDKKDHHHHNESLACHKLAQYNSKSTFDLYRQIALDHPSENIAFSPISISSIFALLTLGAKAHTYSQIMEGFGFNKSEISEQEIHEGFHQLLDVMSDAKREVQLSGVSALFISKEQKILQTFLDKAKKFYHSEAFSTDFKNTEEAKNQINSYVEKNTHGKITDLMKSVDQDAIFVLVNCIYFKAKWDKPFNAEFTREGDFHVNENKTVKVPFMTRTARYNVAFTDEATVVYLPYKGDTSAIFILPKVGKFMEVEQNFNREAIKKWKTSMHEHFIQLNLPKFTITTTLNLKETLNKMGIVDVFTDNADLSGITGSPNLKLSKAVHKVFLSVHEKGTEAAGATALEAVPMMLPIFVDFSSPFMFSIYDTKAESVLFTGRIVNPQN